MTNAQADDIWTSSPWRKPRKAKLRTQKRIFTANKNSDEKTARKLQRLMLQSRDMKLLAVRNVTEMSKGRNTPGIDGVCNLSSKEKLELVENLTLDQRPRPVRRIQIPKAGSNDTRPLGIPTIRDRAMQSLINMALTPQLEAMFTTQDQDTYGFRPGRSRSDAIRATWNFVNKVEGKFIAKCDIEKCFDRIDHEALLAKIETRPEIKRYIKRTLKAGINEDQVHTLSTRGMPQGSPISGLLLNWALMGIEQYICDQFPKTNVVEGNRLKWTPSVIRYADDVIIIHRDHEILKQCIALADEFLGPLGLNLNPKKTQIRSVKDGVDFLGYTIRQFPKDPGQKKSRNGFVTLIAPSKASIKRHYRYMAAIIDRHNAKSQEDLILALNPVITGWANAYSDVNASKAFNKLDHDLHQKLRRWTRRRHNNKPWKYIRAKYFNNGRPWIFRSTAKDATALAKHSETPIRPRGKVPKAHSAFDRSGWKRTTHPLAQKYADDHKDISDAWEDLRTDAEFIEEPDEREMSHVRF